MIDFSVESSAKGIGRLNFIFKLPNFESKFFYVDIIVDIIDERAKRIRVKYNINIINIFPYLLFHSTTIFNNDNSTFGANQDLLSQKIRKRGEGDGENNG